MRISDWSSDVCSSDLGGKIAPDALRIGAVLRTRADRDGNVCRQKEEIPIPCDAAPAARCWTRERPLSPAALPGPVAPARHGGGIVRRTTIPFVPFVVEPPAPYKSVGNPFRTPCDIPRKVFHNVARGYGETPADAVQHFPKSVAPCCTALAAPPENPMKPHRPDDPDRRCLGGTFGSR